MPYYHRLFSWITIKHLIVNITLNSVLLFLVKVRQKKIVGNRISEGRLSEAEPLLGYHLSTKFP